MSFDRKMFELDWVPSCLWSLTICILIFTIFRLVQIKYSNNRTCPDLQLRPYYIIIAYLLCEAIETLIVIDEVSRVKKAAKFNQMWSMSWPIITTFSILKFTMFIIFMALIAFEWSIYILLILFQEELNINQLDVRKAKNQHVEKQLQKVFWIACPIGCIPFVILIGMNWWLWSCLKDVQNHPYVMHHSVDLTFALLFSISATNCFSILVLTSFIGFTGLTLLYKLYKSHKIAFRSHWKGILMQAASIIFAAVCIFANTFFVAQSMLCVETEGILKLLVEKTFENNGSNYCSYLFNNYIDLETSDYGMITQLDIDLVIGLVPIAVFLLTQKPHDCFKCFNKNPELDSYSIFQLNYNKPFKRQSQTLITKIQYSLDFSVSTSYRDSNHIASPRSNDLISIGNERNLFLQQMRQLGGSIGNRESETNATNSEWQTQGQIVLKESTFEGRESTVSFLESVKQESSHLSDSVLSSQQGEE